MTNADIAALQASSSRREVPDGKFGSLYLVVQPSGAKSWALRYRFDGQPRKFTLGEHGKIDPGMARKLATKAMADVANGIDPAGVKMARRVAAAFDKAHEIDLVERVVESFIERYAKAKNRSWEETRRILDREVVARWKGRRLSGIGRADVHELLDAIVDRGAPIMANRVLAALRKTCNWAVERGIVSTSPCDKVKAPAAERSRDRILTDDELRAVWVACGDIGWPFGPLIQLLILTGQRRDEVGSMRWSELDLAAGTWTIPKERAKNGVEHVVPLSPHAFSILDSLPRIGAGDTFVFSMNGASAVSGFSKAKDRIDDCVAVDLGDVPHWVLHDLRRSVASGCARLGVALPVIEKVLNHVSGSFGGITGIYQRYSFADEKRQALEAWGGFVERLVTGEEYNVVNMKVAIQ